MKITVTCKLPPMMEKGEMVGFRVWPGEPYYIPKGLAVHYTKAEDTYLVELKMPVAALKAVAGEREAWDSFNDRPLKIDADDPYDPRAALFWYIEVRGGVRIRPRRRRTG